MARYSHTHNAQIDPSVESDPTALQWAYDPRAHVQATDCLRAVVRNRDGQNSEFYVRADGSGMVRTYQSGRLILTTITSHDSIMDSLHTLRRWCGRVTPSGANIQMFRATAS